MIFTKERGLSRSRNMAIRNSSSDIMLISDDDLYFYDNFDKIIIHEHEKHDKNHIILFNFDNYVKKYSDKNHRVCLWNVGRYASVQTSFKPKEISERGIYFNENYGTGSGKIVSGEENIFLARCSKSFIILYNKKKILRRDPAPSSWFNGYDEKYLFDRGAIYFEMYGYLSFLFMFYFIMRNKLNYPDYSFCKMFKVLKAGKKQAVEYRKII